MKMKDERTVSQVIKLIRESLIEDADEYIPKEDLERIGQTESLRELLLFARDCSHDLPAFCHRVFTTLCPGDKYEDEDFVGWAT